MSVAENLPQTIRKPADLGGQGGDGNLEFLQKREAEKGDQFSIGQKMI